MLPSRLFPAFRGKWCRLAVPRPARAAATFAAASGALQNIAQAQTVDGKELTSEDFWQLVRHQFIFPESAVLLCPRKNPKIQES